MVNDKKIVVRELQPVDLELAAEVHRLAFVRQAHSLEWLTCNLNAKPKSLCYVAFRGEDCVGYIIWTQKSGFRTNVVVELEQIAVAPNYQGEGVGQILITETLPKVESQLSKQAATLKHILVTTRADNHAQRLYRKVLGAEIEASISGLYSADEVIMVARDIGKQNQVLPY